ncbi:MAG: histidinol dehydrogenase, partial [Bacillota bacterium]
MNISKYPDPEIDKWLNERRFKVSRDINNTVKNIIKEVKKRGDNALKEYTERFDGVKLDNFKVDKRELKQAEKRTTEKFINSLNKAIKNIRKFHKKQLRESWFNTEDNRMTGQLFNPIPRIGSYVPGGRAAYPSSVLMTVIPAQVAGVKEIAVVTPPDKKGKI